jgi:hypothetical protein
VDIYCNFFTFSFLFKHPLKIFSSCSHNKISDFYSKQSMKEYNEYVYRFKRDWSLYKFFENPSSSSQRNTNCDIFSESHSNVPLGTKMQENTDHANFIAVESELSYQQMMTAAPVASPAMTKATPGSVPSLKRQLDCDFSESDESFSDSFYNKKIKSESLSPNESFSDSFYNKNIKSESFSPNESIIDLDSSRSNYNRFLFYSSYLCDIFQ